jgi:dihydrofolate reductase
MIISLVVAMDERRGIGVDNRLPWRLSADLQRFKRLTMGRHLIMGRRTYESIGRPLPGRTTIVVTRNPNFRPPGSLVAGSLEEALALAEGRGETEAFVVGGSAIFAAALPLAERIYLTQVHAVAAADVFFPELDRSEWLEKERVYQRADAKNEHPFSFMLLERREVRD